MAASGKQRAGGDGQDVYDVRVVAFGGGSAATLQALQDLFGLDRAGAQRLIDSVPLVVRRGAPANEAQTFVAALRGMGAQVALERPSNLNAVDRPRPTTARGGEPVAVPRPAPRGARPAPPPPVRAAPPPPPPPKAAPGKAPPPPPRDADPLPRPIMRALTADLEFDLAAPGGGDRFDSEPKSSLQPMATKQGSSRGRNEIDFSDEPDAGRLELDIGKGRDPSSDRPATPRNTTLERSAATRSTASDRTTTKTLQPVPEQAAAEGRADQLAGRMSSPEIARGGAGPMSRAAVVHKPGIESKESRARRRQIALARVLGGVAIGALGIMFDSSILYGNANVVSVLAHALAFYQVGVGLRGMAS